MIEKWKKIDGYEYEISSSGKVKSLRNNIILKPDMTRSGYPSVTLYGKKKKLRIHIHRLVAQYFIPNPENKPVVDHINTIKIDNRIENLRWASIKENINNPISIKKHMFPHSEEWNMKIKLAQKKKAVLCIEKNIIFESLCEASRQTGVHQPNITKVLNGLREKAGGFHWKAAFF